MSRDKFDGKLSISSPMPVFTMSAPGPAPVGIAVDRGSDVCDPRQPAWVCRRYRCRCSRVADLPVGLQVLGYREHDAKLFEIAAFLQADPSDRAALDPSVQCYRRRRGAD